MLLTWLPRCGGPPNCHRLGQLGGDCPPIPLIDSWSSHGAQVSPHRISLDLTHNIEWDFTLTVQVFRSIRRNKMDYVNWKEAKASMDSGLLFILISTKTKQLRVAPNPILNQDTIINHISFNKRLKDTKAQDVCSGTLKESLKGNSLTLTLFNHVFVSRWSVFESCGWLSRNINNSKHMLMQQARFH